MARGIVQVRSDRNAIPIQQLHGLEKIEMAMKQMAKNADGTDYNAIHKTNEAALRPAIDGDRWQKRP